uniref:Uncharacterized protein n=1 Tax=Brassica oleracea var. oleracea TaxID=109376 RepID=A0A0D3CRJ0_BRAOL
MKMVLIDFGLNLMKGCLRTPFEDYAKRSSRVNQEIELLVRVRLRLSDMLLSMAFYIGVEGRLRVVILCSNISQETNFWDLVPGCLILCLEMLETSVLGLGQDLGLITALGGAMTTSAYVSRIVFNLIPSCFKVIDMFSAYVTCFSLNPTFEKHSGLSTDVRSQNCCSCSDANNLICDRGIRTEGSRCVHSNSQGRCRSCIRPLYFRVNIKFSSSQMFSMLFRESLGTTETERNALVLEDFS